MSTPAELEVRISANIDRAMKGLDTFSKGVETTAVKASKAGSKIGSDLTKGSNQASQALINLGRVAQDAPYGFIGIANNLNPLLESFQRLKLETGSTKGALSALGSSLLGGGGLGLALSAITAAVSFASIGFSLWTSRMAASKEKADELKTATENIFKESGKEATGVISLIAVLKSQNETYDRKKDALNELKRIQPEYFGQLKLEEGAVIGIDNAYKNYLNNFKQVIAAKVLQSKLEGAITKLLEIQGKTATGLGRNLDATSINFFKAGTAGSNAMEQTAKAINKTKQSAIGLQEVIIDDIFNQLREVSGGIKVPEFKSKEIKAKIGKVIAEVSGKISFKPQSGEFEYDFGGVSFEEALQTQLRKDFNDRTFIKGFEGTFVLPLKVEPKLEIIGGLPQSLNQIDELKKIAYLKGAGVTKGFQDGMKIGIEGLRTGQLDALFSDTKSKIEAFGTQLSAAMSSISEGTLSSIGDTIANAITGSEDSFKGLFTSIFLSVGDQIQQLGKFLIKTGIEIKIAKEAFAKLLSNPLAQIVVGVGLVALGALMKKAANSKPKGFATGVRNFEGGAAIVGERGPELLNLPRGSSVIPNGNLQGDFGGAMVFIPETKIKGQDIYITYKRAEKSFGRNFN